MSGSTNPSREEFMLLLVQMKDWKCVVGTKRRLIWWEISEGEERVDEETEDSENDLLRIKPRNRLLILCGISIGV